MINSNRSRRKGLTMLEVVVSLILVSGILVISLSASANLLRQRNEDVFHSKAQRLAGYFLDEISVLHFVDPDGNQQLGVEDDETSQRVMDDLDDYQGWTQSTPTFRDGQPMPGYEGWTVQVAVSPARLQTVFPEATSDLNNPLRIIDVTVTDSDGMQIVRRGIVARNGQGVRNDVNHLRLQRVRLQLSGGQQTDVLVPHRNRPSTF
ncbi:hypothetical protein LOC67_26735 [Stieleria sp. JC731]|uniref:type IV pilus modification PilV family protein n=1 Tax=Pirellulaceae TaxID=2691357 RepID=UPI001E6348B6|nr:hypothetical protein [Stieleria sp. JC731]MCC9604166.1 hypothetical protein [Stieleria sp. JC731]